VGARRVVAEQRATPAQRRPPRILLPARAVGRVGDEHRDVAEEPAGVVVRPERSACGTIASAFSFSYSATTPAPSASARISGCSAARSPSASWPLGRQMFKHLARA